MQIRWALDHDFNGIHVDPAHLLNSANTLYLESLVTQTTQSLAAGHSTILFTALGASASAISAGDTTLGAELGAVLRAILTRSKTSRVLLCGGDTSSQAVQQLELRALTWLRSLEPGAPLCKAHLSSGSTPLELVLKGGQVGTESFFQRVQQA